MKSRVLILEKYFNFNQNHNLNQYQHQYQQGIIQLIENKIKRPESMSGKYRIWESLKKLMLLMSDILSFNHSTACRATMAWRLGTPTPRHVRPYRKGNKKKFGNFRLINSLFYLYGNSYR
jgi:hypothetical protein